MPKGRKSHFVENEAVHTTNCPYCDWVCVRQINLKFLKEILLRHMKCEHGIIVSPEVLETLGRHHQQTFIEGYEHGLYNKINGLKQIMDFGDKRLAQEQEKKKKKKKKKKKTQAEQTQE